MSYANCHRIYAWNDERMIEVNYRPALDSDKSPKLFITDSPESDLAKKTYSEIKEDLREGEVVLLMRESNFFDIGRSPIVRKFKEGTKALDYLSRSGFFDIGRSPIVSMSGSLVRMLTKVFRKRN